MSRRISVSAAIREGVLEEMRRDPNVMVLGEDVAVMGGTFALTRGFLEEFGPCGCGIPPFPNPDLWGWRWAWPCVACGPLWN